MGPETLDKTVDITSCNRIHFKGSETRAALDEFRRYAIDINPTLSVNADVKAGSYVIRNDAFRNRVVSIGKITPGGRPLNPVGYDPTLVPAQSYVWDITASGKGLSIYNKAVKLYVSHQESSGLVLDAEPYAWTFIEKEATEPGGQVSYLIQLELPGSEGEPNPDGYTGTLWGLEDEIDNARIGISGNTGVSNQYWYLESSVSKR
ncbi:hypothetical protein BGX24_002180 [Mortierella sp. AD032]|nr:hypothetical protein BGX24_002180 [Mortierella sp. AD032]